MRQPEKEDKKIVYTWQEFDTDIKKIISQLRKEGSKYYYVYGIPKGGLCLAVVIANYLNIPLLTNNEQLKNILCEKENIIICDDISDTGKTFIQIRDITNYRTISLFLKQGTQFVPNLYCKTCNRNDWIIFPWEEK